MAQIVITNLTYGNQLFTGQPCVIAHHQATVPDYNDLGKIRDELKKFIIETGHDNREYIQHIERELHSLEHELHAKVDKILQTVYEENKMLKQELANLKNGIMS